MSRPPNTPLRRARRSEAAIVPRVASAPNRLGQDVSMPATSMVLAGVAVWWRAARAPSHAAVIVPPAQTPTTLVSADRVMAVTAVVAVLPAAGELGQGPAPLGAG